MRFRFWAWGIHAGFGLLISVVILWQVMKWYPDFLFWLDGGIHLVGLIVIVDLVLGPCLTFVVYNPAKSLRERVLDLSLVVLLQMAGLGYGLYSGYMARPVMLVFHDDKISSVRWSDLVVQEEGGGALGRHGGVPLPWMYSPPPASAVELAEDLAYYMNTNIRPEVQVHRMRPLQSEWPAVQEQVSGQGRGGEPVSIPYAGRYRDGVLHLSAQGDYIGYLAGDRVDMPDE